MNKFKFLVLVILVSSQICSGKSLLTPSQNDTINLIEKVYLHTDRDIYYAGEDLWFRAYLIDALDHLLTNHSTNLHVELISRDLKLISNRVIRLNEGLGKGDFKLPDDIHSGRYLLRAYTNYMRNLSDELFFTKEITVVNGQDEGEESSKSYNYNKKNISLYFFPEGGSLVENVSSLVGFKAVDYQGLGCSIKGNIYSSSGDLISTFRSTHMGMGSFLFRPLPGLKYYAIFRGSDSIDIKAELPVSFPQGVILSTSRNPDNEFIVTIKTNSTTQSILSNHDLLLSISIRKAIINSIPIRIKAPVTSFVIPTGYLPEGIVMLTLTSPNDLPLSEKLVYIERKPPQTIRIETDKLTYKKREPVNLKISLYGDSLTEEKSNVSLSVVNKTFTNNISDFPGTISSWFLLESDVHGLIENPSYYFDPSNSDRLKNLDLLLLTQGWRDFSWKYDTVKYLPEDGFTISGILKTNNKKHSASDYRVSIGIFGNNNSLVTTVPVDSNWRFELSGIDLTGQATAIISGIDNKNNFRGSLIIDSLRYNSAVIPEGLKKYQNIPEERQAIYKSYYIFNDSIKKNFNLSDTIPLAGVNIISERKDPQTLKVARSRTFYGQPDNELVITPLMETYPDVLALIRGKFPGVEVTSTGMIYIRGIGTLQSGSDAKQSGTTTGQTQSKSATSNASKMPGKPIGLPLVLIDGMQADFHDLTIMPISELDRIDILKYISSTNIYGFSGSYGVINLITKAGGRFADLREDVTNSKLKISGYNVPRIYYSPQHLADSVSAYKPDLRNTLLWEPDIPLEGARERILKFYNSDNSSIIRIIAEGITETGIPISGKAEYEIR